MSSEGSIIQVEYRLFIEVRSRTGRNEIQP